MRCICLSRGKDCLNLPPGGLVDEVMTAIPTCIVSLSYKVVVMSLLPFLLSPLFISALLLSSYLCSSIPIYLTNVPPGNVQRPKYRSDRHLRKLGKCVLKVERGAKRSRAISVMMAEISWLINICFFLLMFPLSSAFQDLNMIPISLFLQYIGRFIILRFYCGERVGQCSLVMMMRWCAAS